MKKSFCDRVKAMELRLENRQINEPSIYIDNETGLTMQIVGAGLVVPAPLNEEEWEKYVNNALKNTQNPVGQNEESRSANRQA